MICGWPSSSASGASSVSHLLAPVVPNSELPEVTLLVGSRQAEVGEDTTRISRLRIPGTSTNNQGLPPLGEGEEQGGERAQLAEGRTLNLGRPVEGREPRVRPGTGQWEGTSRG